MKDLIKKHLDAIGLLAEVIYSMENSDGRVSPDIYVKIKNHLGEDDYSEEMQKQINTWRELYGENSIPLGRS